jgi:hypothetical protein
MAAPLSLTLLVAGAYNHARFGSPLETGYGIAHLNGVLAERRAIGLFSLQHLPDNLARLVARGFDVQGRFPYLVPDIGGHSILLTTPAVLMAVRAGIRRRLPQVLWAATLIVAIPVLLYYGGGGARTYGYRYVLDFLPFMLTLMALAAKVRFGVVERLLIVASVAFSSYGLLWFLAN